MYGIECGSNVIYEDDLSHWFFVLLMICCVTPPFLKLAIALFNALSKVFHSGFFLDTA